MAERLLQLAACGGGPPRTPPAACGPAGRPSSLSAMPFAVALVGLAVALSAAAGSPARRLPAGPNVNRLAVLQHGADGEQDPCRTRSRNSVNREDLCLRVPHCPTVGTGELSTRSPTHTKPFQLHAPPRRFGVMTQLLNTDNSPALALKTDEAQALQSWAKNNNRPGRDTEHLSLDCDAGNCGTKWKRYDSVSCAGNRVVEDLGNISLANCQRLCLQNGFGMFADWDNVTGHCVVYLYCDNPKCHTAMTTYHALRPGQKPWKMGCAANPPEPKPPAPAPGPKPPVPAPPPTPMPPDVQPVPGAWLRYDSVSCEGNHVVQDLGVQHSLESCKRKCYGNGFGMFASWDNSSGHCVVYLYCDNPKCGSPYSTYHALRGGQRTWKMGCAAGPLSPAPPSPPAPIPAPGLVVPCFDPSCVHWKDTDGNRIEAHAAGMLQSPSGRWYWYGESKKTPSLSEHGVNCYSAPDISGPWKNEGQVLQQSDIHVHGQHGPFVVERPKVLYNTNTSRYVMWFHLDHDDYKFAHVGVATAKRPQGPFTFEHSLLPDAKPSEDMSLFRDPQDGQAYFVRSVANQYTAISRLTSDYLNSTGIISNHSVFEGMALFRHANGTYYMVASHLTGWGPNPLILFRAAGKTLDDPQWVAMGNPTGDEVSFNSQPTYVVQYTPHTGDPYFVYMGDNWVHASNKSSAINALVDAAYVWLPFWFKEDRIELHRQSTWQLESPFPSCPTAGTQLFLSECGRDGQSWEVSNTTGRLALTGSELCVAYDNASHAILGSCVSAPAFEWTGEALQTGARCMSVPLCENAICPGEFVSMGDCDDTHGNQAFAVRQTLFGAALLQSKMDESKCLTACT